jgi:16S rRNA (guanine527-N7)-methyltransferase
MFHVKHEAWAERAAEVGSPLDEGQLDRLTTYLDLLSKHALSAGMVAPSDADRLWERHIVDSLRAVPLLGGAHDLVDLGSGAGLPGVPLAVALPVVSVTLVEQRRQRVAFLELVAERLGLANVRVVGSRASGVGRHFDVAAARAFGSVRVAWGAAEPLLRPGGRLVYWAGTRFDASAEAPQDIVVGVVASGVAKAGPLVIMARR